MLHRCVHGQCVQHCAHTSTYSKEHLPCSLSLHRAIAPSSCLCWAWDAASLRSFPPSHPIADPLSHTHCPSHQPFCVILEPVTTYSESRAQCFGVLSCLDVFCYHKDHISFRGVSQCFYLSTHLHHLPFRFREVLQGPSHSW